MEHELIARERTRFLVVVPQLGGINNDRLVEQARSDDESDDEGEG